jgi:hypothetical protein
MKEHRERIPAIQGLGPSHHRTPQCAGKSRGTRNERRTALLHCKQVQAGGFISHRPHHTKTDKAAVPYN